jgi:PAS domain S-box-containing protein
MPAKKGAFSYETGSLSKEEIGAIFTIQPIDITFVDAKDTVRYYSPSPRRIFARNPAVIGKKVQQCHPPRSIDKVNAILSDFRAGRRDAAEFWINLNGRMVYIRYFALRGEKGKYLGCLEASQDITEIQKLRGEKRL